MILLLNLFLSFLAFQTFVIVGSVRDQSRQAVTGVRVSVTDENFQPIRTIFVDSSGRFTVRGLSSGRYLFRVETTGTPFEEQTQRLELQALRIRTGGSETYPLDIILKRKVSKEASPSTNLIFAQEVPDAAKSQYERAVNHLKNSQIEMGIAELKNAIDLFPNYFNALERLGTEYVKDEQFELALPILARALEVNRRAPRSLYALGVAHLKLNHPNEAIELLKKSAQMDPNNPNVPMMLGLAYGNLRDLKQAEFSFKKALQIGGVAMAEAHFYLAGVYDKQERYTEASRELELYLKEAKDIKDPAQIRSMIQGLKDKTKEKPKG
ncbi:MAG: tetratricopeptide repeat protein [Acidobacteriota bacterium]